MSLDPATSRGSREVVSAFGDDALASHDAVALRSLILKKEIAVSEIVSAAVERAKTVNPQLNAIAVPDFERAFERSAACPTDRPLGGIPTFIKDTDEVEGLPLYMGSESLPGEISAAPSPIVEQINSTGMVTLGTSTTPEFGFTGTTESLRFGATRNPWNTEFSTGGSSGGSSALVAAGVVPIAHANDGAGSIRIPASCCGVVGMKPTRGRLAGKDVPAYLPANIFHEGVVTRTVRDTFAFYEAIELARGLPASLPSVAQAAAGELQPRAKIALLLENCAGVRCDSQCVEAASATGLTLQSLGHEVEEISNPFYTRFDEDFWILWSHCAFAVRYFMGKDWSKRFDPSRLQIWAKYLVKHQWQSMPKLPGAFARLKRFIQDYDQLFQDYDVLLTPTLGTPPPKLGYFGPAVPGEVHFARKQPFLPFTKYQNVSGAAAISLPATLSFDQVPIGVQLAGRCGDDARLLQIAMELESSDPWPSLASV